MSESNFVPRDHHVTGSCKVKRSASSTSLTEFLLFPWNCCCCYYYYHHYYYYLYYYYYYYCYCCCKQSCATHQRRIEDTDATHSRRYQVQVDSGHCNRFSHHCKFSQYFPALTFQILYWVVTMVTEVVCKSYPCVTCLCSTSYQSSYPRVTCLYSTSHQSSTVIHPTAVPNLHNLSHQNSPWPKAKAGTYSTMGMCRTWNSAIYCQ